MEQEAAGAEHRTPDDREPSAAEPAASESSATGAPAKADIGKRVIAAIIDAVIGAVVSLVPLVGGLATTAYWLVRDGLEFEFMDRRSIGKKVMKLRPVRLDGEPMDITMSVKRNWPFAFGGIALVLAYIPVIGWLLLIPVGLIGFAVGVVEAVLCFTDAQGRRMGDKYADTMVVEVDS